MKRLRHDKTRRQRNGVRSKFNSGKNVSFSYTGPRARR